MFAMCVKECQNVMFLSIIFGGILTPEVAHSFGGEKSSKDLTKAARGGVKSVPSSKPIINGKVAGDHEFPYIVALKFRADPTGDIAGGGSIISKPKSPGSEWILTARHMLLFINSTVPYIKFRELIVFPKYDNKWQNLAKYPYYNIVQTYCHPWPKSQKFPIDDIALLELDSKIEFDIPPHNFKSVPLADKNFDVNKEFRVKVAGWGLNQTVPNPIMIPDYLMKIEPRVIPPIRCSRIYKEFTEREKFCSMDVEKGVIYTTCGGDSGSPVMVNKSGTGDIQVGLVEAGNPPCTGPSIMVKIAYYREWIDMVMDKRPKELDCHDLLKNRPD